MTQHAPGGSAAAAYANELYVDGSYAGSQENGSPAAPYTTIAAALSAASAGDLVRVRPGTYAEDLTLVDGVDLLGEAGPRGDSPTVTGTATASDVGCSIRDMAFVDDGAGNALYVTGTAAETITLEGVLCTGTATGASPLECDNSSAIIVANNSQFVMTTGNATETVRVESGTLNAFDCVINHEDNTSESLVAEGDAATTIRLDQCSLQGTVGSEAASANPTMTIKRSAIVCGAAECLAVAAGNTVTLADVEMTSTEGSNDAITGGGSVAIDDLRFLSTADEINTGVTVTHLAGSRIQTGTVAVSGASPQVDSVTFAQVMPSTSYVVHLTFEATGGAADDTIATVDEGTIATTGFDIVTTNASAAAVGGNVHWIAIHD